MMACETKTSCNSTVVSMTPLTRQPFDNIWSLK